MTNPISYQAKWLGFPYRFDHLSIDTPIVSEYSRLAEAFNVLDKQDGYPVGLSKEKTFRYIILMYTPGSPALGLLDINERKAWSAFEAGFRQKRGKASFGPVVDSLLLGEHPSIQRTITIWLSSHFSTKFALLRSLEDAFYMQLQTIRQGSGNPSDTVKLSRQIDDLISEMDGEIPRERRLIEVMQFLKVTSLGVRPLEYTEAYMEGEDLFPELSSKQ